MKWSAFNSKNSDEYVGGDFNAIDDVTGFKVKASSLKRQWDGHMTQIPLKRNEQDFLRGVKESHPTWSRIEQEDQFGQFTEADL